MYESQRNGKYLPRGFTFLDHLQSCRKFPQRMTYLQTSASGHPEARTKLLVVVLAAGLASSFHISYVQQSTLVLVLTQACIGAATCACTATLLPLTASAI